MNGVKKIRIVALKIYTTLHTLRYKSGLCQAYFMGFVVADLDEERVSGQSTHEIAA